MDTKKPVDSHVKPFYSDYKELIIELKKNLSPEEYINLRNMIKESFSNGIYKQSLGVGSIAKPTIGILQIMMKELRMRSPSIIAMVLTHPVERKGIALESVEKVFGKEVSEIIKGLIKLNGISASKTAIASENYVRLLVTLAEDLRVLLVMIASALFQMRNIHRYSSDFQLDLSMKVKHLYAPLAHKLGLYAVKTEMEDLYLKYTDKDAYDFVIKKLKDSEEKRNKFISDFIAPIEEKLSKTGLKYDMKGRVKSASSINNKLLKQQIDFESIYDIFAIRVILDAPIDQEKAQCWQVYSIITDMYTPNPKRLKDWLSIPKGNGYESLHTTVMGPKSRWVEVQIRSKRMDDIAERGFAAHWKYKGIKSQSKLDDWLTNLREILENKTFETSEKMEDFKLDVYDDEIYVFTPKGDLYTLPKGATILDFAFAIHSKVGETCVSGKVNGKNVPIKHVLSNGDQVEIVTSPNQLPKQDWLNFVRSSKAKQKIRQCLKEKASQKVDIAKELLLRRFKNKKIELQDVILTKLIKKYGIKNLTEFYIRIAEESLNINDVIDLYLQLEKRENESQENYTIISADQYVNHPEPDEAKNVHDELILDRNLTGVDYSLAKCCNPIYGDEIFGFVSNNGIKIHRQTCPNAHDLFGRFAYRIIPARWSGASSSSYTVMLRVIGNDDITIVNNITSLITKEDGVGLRSINIDSNDGVFHGNIGVTLTNKDKLNKLIKKIQGVKGVKMVSRAN